VSNTFSPYLVERERDFAGDSRHALASKNASSRAKVPWNHLLLQCFCGFYRAMGVSPTRFSQDLDNKVSFAPSCNTDQGV